MKAAVFHGRRDIRIESVPEPVPAAGEVVLEVLRAAICGTDSAEWSRGPVLARPMVTLGHEFVGRVCALGNDVGDLAVGDRVVSGAGVSCGSCEWCRAGRTNPAVFPRSAATTLRRWCSHLRSRYTLSGGPVYRLDKRSQ